MAILKLTDICKDYVQGKEPVRVLKNVNLTLLEDNKAIFTEQGEMLPREVIAEKIRLALGLE